MEMSAFLHQVRSDVEALGRLGGPDLEAAVDRLLIPMEPVLRTRLLEALAQVGAELTADLPSGRVETRVEGDEVVLAFRDEAVAEPAPDSAADLDARITLRLPESLKSRIDAAAAQQGVSVNTWLVRALERTLTPTVRGRQMRGFGVSH